MLIKEESIKGRFSAQGACKTASNVFCAAISATTRRGHTTRISEIFWGLGGEQPVVSSILPTLQASVSSGEYGLRIYDIERDVHNQISTSAFAALYSSTYMMTTLSPKTSPSGLPVPKHTAEILLPFPSHPPSPATLQILHEICSKCID